MRKYNNITFSKEVEFHFSVAWSISVYCLYTTTVGYTSTMNVYDT